MKSPETLAAEAEIRDLHVRFCRATDRRDEQALRACFHPDAFIEVHEAMALDAFVAMGREVLSRFAVTWHSTSNQLVEVAADGLSAWAEHYTTSYHRIPADDDGPERDFIAHGRYTDHVERRDGSDGAWRIARRRYEMDFTRVDAVGDGMLGPGRAGRADGGAA